MKIFNTAFHVYLLAIKYSLEIGFGCPKCPSELGKGELEEDFDAVEVHISDGIDMGCQENATKGIVPDTVFKLERAGEDLVKGTDCYEYLANKSNATKFGRMRRKWVEQSEHERGDGNNWK